MPGLKDDPSKNEPVLACETLKSCKSVTPTEEYETGVYLIFLVIGGKLAIDAMTKPDKIAPIGPPDHTGVLA
jgi:hypothetical protein